MQVRKFEAPTLLEALDVVKRELGPEAIILQTKKNKKGFGLLSRDSVEVTAAVSDKNIQKKSITEGRLPEPQRRALEKFPAEAQAKTYDRFADRHMEAPLNGQLNAQLNSTRDQVQIGRSARQQFAEDLQKGKKIEKSPIERLTSTPPPSRRYVDIDSEEMEKQPPSFRAAPALTLAMTPNLSAIPGKTMADGSDPYETIETLKREMTELRERLESSVLESNKEGPRNNAFQDRLDYLITEGIDRRYAFELLRQASESVPSQFLENPDVLFDQLAERIMSTTNVHEFFSGIHERLKTKTESETGIRFALVGPKGAGISSMVAKIATQAAQKENLRVGLIRVGESIQEDPTHPVEFAARVLRVPIRRVQSGDGLHVALGEMDSLDLILIDVEGVHTKNREEHRKNVQVLQAIEQLRVLMVLPAVYRDQELWDQASKFKNLTPESIIFTFLDEASTHGTLYNLSRRLVLPILFFSQGPSIPDDLEEATPERLAALILRIESTQ